MIVLKDFPSSDGYIVAIAYHSIVDTSSYSTDIIGIDNFMTQSILQRVVESVQFKVAIEINFSEREQLTFKSKINKYLTHNTF